MLLHARGCVAAVRVRLEGVVEEGPGDEAAGVDGIAGVATQVELRVAHLLQGGRALGQAPQLQIAPAGHEPARAGRPGIDTLALLPASLQLIQSCGMLCLWKSAVA